MKVLVVVAHPDDEALGCGGTIAKLADEGHRISVLLTTRRCDPRGTAHWETLMAAFAASCRLLGAEALSTEPLLPETQAEPQVHKLHDAILPYVEDAEQVLTHWIGDVNQVHRGVAHAVQIATRPFRRRRDVSCFEVPTSTDQGFGGAGAQAFHPTEYVLLSARQARRKCDALAHYDGELVAGRTPEDVERRLRLRGAEVGAEYAEAFVVARRFR